MPKMKINGKFGATKVAVRQAGRKGRGVFAIGRLRKGERIEVAPYLALSAREHDVIKRTDLIRFIFDSGAGRAALALGSVSIYNHSETPNAEYVLDKKNRTITIRALLPIRIGSEITVDYGYHPALPQTWDKDYKAYMSRQSR